MSDSVWCNHSNQGDLDCDLAPVAAGGCRTADLGLTVLTQMSSVWCNHSNQGDLDGDLAPVATGGGRTADLGLTIPHTGEHCME